MNGFIYAHSVLFRIASKAVCLSRHDNQQAISALVFSFLGTEGFVNTLASISPKDIPGKDAPAKALQLHDALAELEHTKESLTSKIQIAKIILSGVRYDPGVPPFQDFRILVRIRNQLVHHHPQHIYGQVGKDDFGTEFPTFLRDLESRSLIMPFDRKVVQSWEGLISTPQVAEWAYRSVHTVITDLVASYPPCPIKRIMEMMIPELKEIEGNENPAQPD